MSAPSQTADRGNSVVDRVHRQVEAVLRGPAAGASSLVVAVSGGPDSMALLHALLHLRGRLGLSLRGAHLDHGLRGDAGAADAAFAADSLRRRRRARRRGEGGRRRVQGRAPPVAGAGGARGALRLPGPRLPGARRRRRRAGTHGGRPGGDDPDARRARKRPHGPARDGALVGASRRGDGRALRAPAARPAPRRHRGLLPRPRPAAQDGRVEPLARLHPQPGTDRTAAAARGAEPGCSRRAAQAVHGRRARALLPRRGGRPAVGRRRGGARRQGGPGPEHRSAAPGGAPYPRAPTRRSRGQGRPRRRPPEPRRRHDAAAEGPRGPRHRPARRAAISRRLRRGHRRPRRRRPLPAAPPRGRAPARGAGRDPRRRLEQSSFGWRTGPTTTRCDSPAMAAPGATPTRSRG